MINLLNQMRNVELAINWTSAKKEKGWMTLRIIPFRIDGKSTLVDFDYAYAVSHYGGNFHTDIYQPARALCGMIAQVLHLSQKDQNAGLNFACFTKGHNDWPYGEPNDLLDYIEINNVRYELEDLKVLWQEAQKEELEQLRSEYEAKVKSVISIVTDEPLFLINRFAGANVSPKTVEYVS